MTIEFLVSAVARRRFALLVAALGMQANPGDGAALLRQPGRLLRSLTSMLVVMPIVAAALAYSFNLDPTVKTALVALALSPVPPFLPPKNIKGGGTSSYAIGLLVATSLVSIVYVPLALALLELVFDIPLHLSVSHVIVPVGWTVLCAPDGGTARRAFRTRPRGASRAGPSVGLPLSSFSCGLIPLMATSLSRAIPLLGNGTLLAMLAFCLIGLGLVASSGRAPGDRATLALATAARHPRRGAGGAKADFPRADARAPGRATLHPAQHDLSPPYSRWA